ncbi:MAG: hypothetical protein J07AB43_00400 [Candidatus Nanosalina sp. J07AB43]|jgi:hypothetical protein|nr:MAG: hypothetical protein J07AB43_00400 [Candidatus Nanosalina sp. J07AB43]
MNYLNEDGEMQIVEVQSQNRNTSATDYWDEHLFVDVHYGDGARTSQEIVTTKFTPDELIRLFDMDEDMLRVERDISLEHPDPDVLITVLDGKV